MVLHYKIVSFKDGGGKEKNGCILKNLAKQNNVKLGKQKAGLLPATFSQQGDVLSRAKASPGLM